MTDRLGYLLRRASGWHGGRVRGYHSLTEGVLLVCLSFLALWSGPNGEEVIGERVDQARGEEGGSGSTNAGEECR